MDPRIAWCTPEQLGPAYKHWLRIWEASTASNNRNGAHISHHQHLQEGDMIENTNPNRINLENHKQQDFIPLFIESEKSDSRKERFSRIADNNGYGPNGTAKMTPGYINGHGHGFVDGANVNIASTYALNHSSNLGILESRGYIPWLKPNKRYPESTIMCLHEEIKDFYDYMHPTPAEQYMRTQVVESITEIINSLWPQAKVEVFGSFETDLYLPTSDIDLVVFGKWPDKPLHTLGNELLKQGIAEEDTLKVLDKASIGPPYRRGTATGRHAAVPIIKLIDRKTNVKVDISFNQVNGVRSVKIIKEFLHLYPNLKYLVIVLKQYLLQRDLNEVYTGGIGSYCLLYLVISFLQMHNSYDASNPDCNLAVLLMEFFELYGHKFNYHNVGIRIQNGGSYVPKQKLVELHSNGVVPSYLYIEDPVNPANDVGKSSYGAYRVKESFVYAFSVLFRNTGSYTRGHSVLGRIIRVTDKVCEYRRWINSTFQPLDSPCLRLPVDEMSSSDTADVSNDTQSTNRHTGTGAPPAKGKSYAKAVTANSLSKRTIASGSKSSIHSQRSGAEFDCQTDASSASPLSTTSASASSSSSLASDSDNESVSTSGEKSEPPKKAMIYQRPPGTAHKTVSVSTLTSKPAAVKCTVSVKSSQSRSAQPPPTNSNVSRTTAATSSASSAPSYSNNNSHGKSSYSKHSSYPSLVVHNSNTKPLVSSSTSTAATTGTSAQPYTSNSIQPSNKSNQKQAVNKRKRSTTQASAVSKGNTGRNNGSTSR